MEVKRLFWGIPLPAKKPEKVLTRDEKIDILLDNLIIPAKILNVVTKVVVEVLAVFVFAGIVVGLLSLVFDF